MKLATLKDGSRDGLLAVVSRDLKTAHIADGIAPTLMRGWEISRIAGADIYFAAERGNNRALRVQFHDRRVAFRNVSQWLFLPPGDYRLKGRVKLVDLQAAQGLSWTLVCAGDTTLMGKSERLVGNSDWRSFTLEFAIREEQCGAQQLRLILDARIAAEQQISGEAWFDDFVIELLAPRIPVPAQSGKVPVATTGA